MKHKIITLALAAIVTGISMNSCSSSNEQVKEAEEKVQDAKDTLHAVEKSEEVKASNKANAEEWAAFKVEATKKIGNNQIRIMELKEKMKKSGKVGDAVYSKNIELLEQRNNNLKMKMDNYENEQTDWDAFKREFNQDMDNLGQSLKDFTVDSNK